MPTHGLPSHGLVNLQTGHLMEVVMHLKRNQHFTCMEGQSAKCTLKEH